MVHDYICQRGGDPGAPGESCLSPLREQPHLVNHPPPHEPLHIRASSALLHRHIDTLRRISQTFSDENQKYVTETLKNVRTSSDRLDSIAKNTEETAEQVSRLVESGSRTGEKANG